MCSYRSGAGSRILTGDGVLQNGWLRFPRTNITSDGSEGNGAMGEVSIVLGNSEETGSIQVDRTEEGKHKELFSFVLPSQI
jgi:hypothetical protein